MVRLFEFDKGQVLPQLRGRLQKQWQEGKKAAEEREAWKERQRALRRKR